MTAEDYKAQGNEAFSAGDYQVAVTFFTQAIEMDSSNHVLYSNRSAAYASLKDYENAVIDAEKTVSLKPDWSKGYSRKGAALHGLGKLQEAVEAYKKGLEIDPQNALLKKGLNDVENAIENDALGGMGKIFGPDMWSKIASNPKLAPFLAQPDLVQILQGLQKDPQNMSSAMQDPRVMQIMIGLMGLDAQVATNQDELAKAKEEAQRNLDKRNAEEAAAKKEEPVVELTDEEKEAKSKRDKSDSLKSLGNASYKKRQFEEALAHYDAAWNADDTNVAVLTNKSAVLFEMEKYDECIKVCEDAVEIGRSVRADFKLIARALARIGSVHNKRMKYADAIKYFEKSLSEHRTADTLEKLREAESAKKKQETEAYIDPKLADESRERGNTLFKEHNYAESVKAYTEATKRNPKDPKNFSNRAAAYAKLMALPEAERDCDEAIKLDPNFIKAYIRKAAIQFTKREYQKCVETCNLALEFDTEKKHENEIKAQMQKAYMSMGAQNNTGSAEERYQRAMQDPEVAQIMTDPAMKLILQQMQEDPNAARE